MCAVILQLKPHQESFYKVVHDKIRGLDAIVLCEGATDAEVAKKILQKMEETLPKAAVRQVIAFTDAGGKENIPLLTNALLALLKLSRKLRTIAVVVDAEESTAERRAKSLIDSLLSRKGDLRLQLAELQRDSACSQVFTSNIRVNGRNLKLVLVINGDFSLPFTRHTLEDHCLKLVGTPLPRELQTAAQSAKQLLDIATCLDRVGRADLETACKAFAHICRALELLCAESVHAPQAGQK
jgi:hypothetical protein